MKFEITGYSKNKRVMFFEKIAHLDVRLTEEIKELPRHKYLVTVNMLSNYTFQYDPETRKFYVDTADNDAEDKQAEEHIKMTEGKTPEEAAELLKGAKVDYIIRQEFLLFYGNNEPLATLVDKYITHI